MTGAVRWRRLAISACSAAVLLTAVPPAGATFTHCFRAGKALTFYVQSEAAHLRVFVTDKGLFKWENLNTHTIDDCEGDSGASVTNVDTVRVQESAGKTMAPTLLLDFRNRWGPGATPEEQGRSEIEVTVEFGGGPPEELRIKGGRRADRIVFGADGINVTRDKDLDISVVDGDFFFAQGLAKGDVLLANGGFGTGTVAEFPVMFQGDAGPDLMIGGRGPDVLRGLGGSDTSYGLRGQDRIFSDAGEDVLEGGRGADELDGMKHADVLRGQGGPDDLEGGPGPDGLRGGGGIDKCRGGPGADSIAGCEE